MTSKDFKKVGRLLKTLYRELENRAIEEGIDITSDEYEQMRDEVRDTILTKMGYTIMEYRVAKNETLEQQKAQRGQERQEFMEMLEEIQESIPTEEMIKELAKSVIPEPKIIEKTINKIVKEIEKPTIVQETKTIIEREEYDDSELKSALKSIVERFNAIPEPKEFDKESFLEEVKNTFGEMFDHNINTMDMPDFRKLAMGIQAQIDELKNNPSSGGAAVWGGITGTLSDQTDLNSALSGKAASDHVHTGVYEPADATILKSTAIGVSVAAQSHTHTVSQITDFPTLATVATSGDYDDLINKPSAGGLTALQTASLISIRF